MKEPKAWEATIADGGGTVGVLATKKQVYVEIDDGQYAWCYMSPAEARSFAAALLAAADRAEGKS